MISLQGISILLAQPSTILLIALGVFGGIYIGAIPGLSVTMAASILISMTFSWDMYSALALMIGVFVGGVYGGSRSAIVLNIPGAPAAIVTSLDGYPLAKLGKAGETIGIATVQSVIGGYIGIAIMLFATPLVGKVALMFSSTDYFLVGLMGVLLIGSISSNNAYKGILMGVLGIILGLVGMDPLSGAPRFTFGSINLMNGISFIVVMIGLFGIGEVLYQSEKLNKRAKPQSVVKIFPPKKETLRFLPLSIRASLIGALVGALPGTGGDIAALLAYDNAARTVKNPSRPFGQGAIEGVIAPEAANNAAIGGAFIPMLTLGIPGDSVTAIIIGAMLIHGLRPGPMLINDNPEIFSFIALALIIANTFLLPLGLMGIKLFTKVVEIKKSYILPIVLVLSVVGAYSIRLSTFDIYMALAFGVLGYFMKINKYPVGPVVLGMILGPLIENNLRRAYISSGDFKSLLIEVFTKPISISLVIIITSLLMLSFKNKRRLKHEK